MSLRFHQPILLKKFKTWTTPFDPEYLDEVSEFKAVCDELHLRKKGESYTPKAWESLSYLTKENLGQVHAAGFIRTLAAENPNGSHSHFESLPNAKRKNRIAKTWQTHAEKFPALRTTHHRLIFSLSTDFQSALVKAGLNPDQVLHSVVKKTMRNFSEQFHQGDALGYCYGFHHDTDNLHAHVFVHPRTRQGERVSFSSQLKVKKHDPHRADKLGFLKGAAQRQINQWIGQIEDRPLRQLPFQAERLYFIPRQAPTFTADAAHNTKVRQLRQTLTRLDQELKERRGSLFRKTSPISALAANADSLFRQAQAQPDELKTIRQVMHSAAKSLLVLAGRRMTARSLPRQLAASFRESERRRAWLEFRALQKKRHALWLEYRVLTQQTIYGTITPGLQTKINAGPRRAIGLR